jgi:hypothetical protein
LPLQPWAAVVGKFGQVISGELGGPPAALGPFLGEFLGIERGSISIKSDGKRHHIKVDELVDYLGERVTLESGAVERAQRRQGLGPEVDVRPLEVVQARPRRQTGGIRVGDIAGVSGVRPPSRHERAR